MITAAVLDVLAMIAQALLDALPDTEVPEWVNSGSNFIPLVFNLAGSLGVWIPWALIGIVSGAVIGTWVLAFGFKLVRIIISHVTGGGGSAA